MTSLLRTRRVHLAAVAALALCPAAVCLAQPAGAPSLLYVGFNHVKPDMIAEWEDLWKNEVNPAFKKAGHPDWLDTWQVFFGDGPTFVTVAPIPNFAVFDSPHPLVEALGAEAATRLFAKMRKCVDGGRNQMLRLREDLSVTGNMEKPPALAVVASVRVTPGRQQDFENIVRNDTMPAIKKLGARNLVHQTVFGGDANEWVIVTMYDKFAELDSGPLLIRALGPEGYAKLMNNVRGVLASVTIDVARYRADLSFRKEQ